MQTPQQKPAPAEVTRIVNEIKTFLGSDSLKQLIETLANSITLWIKNKEHLQLDDRVKGGTIEGLRSYVSVLEARSPAGT